MIKLRKIISKLDSEVYDDIEKNLLKNKADNFLFLAQSYRNGEISDDEIISKLNLNFNSFYVLKSRLFDKIQEHLAEDISVNQSDIYRQLQEIQDMYFNSPREITTAFLQKLEKDLLAYDMHSELLLVYSTLKKIHLSSNRYFYYSQLYNKHIAFWLSLEKAEDILGNFNRHLGQYDFSRSAPLLEKLLFLRKEILNHLALYQSRQIEITKNLIELELCIFCGSETLENFDVTEVLAQTRKKIDELPDSALHKKWTVVLDYLSFEYFKRSSLSKAQQFFEKANSQLINLLLYSSVALTPKFLMSKAGYLGELGRVEEIIKDKDVEMLHDPEDAYSLIYLGLYRSLASYYSGNYKEAINILNELINTHSFKDYFHINMEVKFTLAWYYIRAKEYDMAENLLKSIYKKIKADGLGQYSNALDLIKVFTADINQKDARERVKQKDSFTLFLARNTGDCELLNHLIPELKKCYL